MTYGKTIQELRTEYAPYNMMPAFDEGMRDYAKTQDRSPRYHSIAAQAYDRGQECAMRIQRNEDWVRDNVGAN